jgi:hypothetical protein
MSSPCIKRRSHKNRREIPSPVSNYENEQNKKQDRSGHNFLSIFIPISKSGKSARDTLSHIPRHFAHACFTGLGGLRAVPMLEITCSFYTY